MKRKYEKPFLAVESFQLNAAIAGSCSGVTSIGHYEDSCGYGKVSDNYWYYFNDVNCEVDVTGNSGGDNNDTPCYHGPYSTADGMTFVWS